jgi:hypothetical protein
MYPTGAVVCHPNDEDLSSGTSILTRELVSRILFYAVIPLGEALPLALISDLPEGCSVFWNRFDASGRCVAQPGSLARAFLPIWSCSVWGLPCLRHYCRSGALLPHLFTLTGLAVQAYALRANCPCRNTNSPAVCFLWHWPSVSLKAHVPDVIRHTALRSSDFPLPKTPLARGSRQRPPGPPASFQFTAKTALLRVMHRHLQSPTLCLI